MKPLNLFYHIYLTDNPSTWSSIFIEQMKLMEDHKLLQAFNKIHFNVVSKNDGRTNQLTSLLQMFLPSTNKSPVEIRFHENPYKDDNEMLTKLEHSDTITENSAMRWIYDFSKKNDGYVCYVHSKGITSVQRHLQYANAHDFMKYYYWRQYLNWGVIEQWNECVRALEKGYDIAGVNYYTSPSNHYSGNFWWSKTDHIRILADPSTKDWWYGLKKESKDNWLRNAPDRFRDEQWPCSRKDIIAYNVYDLKDVPNPAAKILRREVYDKYFE